MLALLGAMACADDATVTAPELEISEVTGAAPSAFVPSLVVTRKESVLGRGDRSQLKVVDTFGTPVAASELEWASALPSVATVSSGGVVRGVAPGTTVITARSGGRIAQHSAVVVGGGSSALRVRPLGATALAPGEVKELSATDGRGSRVAASALSWSTSAPTVASVSPGGVVTARASGHAVITIRRGTGVAQHGVLVGQANGVEDGPDEIGPPSEPEGSDRPAGLTPAFPGAEGYGAGALSSCDRSRPHVFVVDDRGDSGPGTLRGAMAAAESAPDDQLKVITFTVGGYIRLYNGLSFSGNCLYVAGQTAPGDGITVRGSRLEFHRDARDIVLRYFRIRVGTTGGDPEAILVRKGKRYVFDHLSLSWSDGTLLRFTRTPIGRSGMMSDISVQHSLLGETLSEHPTALAIGGNPKPDEDEHDAAWKYHARYSIHNNALVSNHHRNGQAPGQDLELINNVVHNWGLDAGQVRYGASVDWVNNYFQKGPMSRSGYAPIGIRSSSIATRPFLRPSLHIAGNVSFGGDRFPDQNPRPGADNWQGSTRLVGWYHRDTGDSPLTEFRRSARLTTKAPVGVTVRDPFDAYQSVLETAGASRGLDCEGRWFSRRDAVDQRLIQDVRRKTGPNRSIGSEGEVGGFPSLATGTACADSNGDGVPDAWMRANGLDPRGPSVVGRIGSAGYSYLEHYLNGTPP